MKYQTGLLKMLLPNIFVSPVFSLEEIEKIDFLADHYDLYQGKVQNNNSVFKEIDNIRISKISFFKRNETETAWIFKRIDNVVKQVNESYFNFDLHTYQSIQYTTYDGKDRGTYNWHMDSGRFPRKLSMTVFLNDDYEGGDFEICVADQKDAQKFKGKPGDAILFPSFMIHRVAPVIGGIRKSLVIWVEGPEWR